MVSPNSQVLLGAKNASRSIRPPPPPPPPLSPPTSGRPCQPPLEPTRFSPRIIARMQRELDELRAAIDVPSSSSPTEDAVLFPPHREDDNLLTPRPFSPEERPTASKDTTSNKKNEFNSVKLRHKIQVSSNKRKRQPRLPKKPKSSSSKGSKKGSWGGSRRKRFNRDNFFDDDEDVVDDDHHDEHHDHDDADNHGSSGNHEGGDDDDRNDDEEYHQQEADADDAAIAMIARH